MNGILPLWKPKGLTSHDCVSKLRKLYQTKKVGHTGTLDPEVEGVLPICIGQATKIVPFLTETKKTYIAEVTLGVATETEDRYGKIIDETPVNKAISNSNIEHVLQTFKGKSSQIPPMYSAVKVKGKKLYEYAREGKSVDRPIRTIEIDSINAIQNSLKNDHGKTTFQFEVICSKGTYIRTLCVDIGKKLGYPAHMSSLVRTKTGSFNEEDTYTLEQVQHADNLELLLQPIIRGVDHLAVYFVDEHLKSNVRYGQKLHTPEPLPATTPFRIQFQDELLAIYQLHPKDDEIIKPVRVFH